MAVESFRHDKSVQGSNKSGELGIRWLATNCERLAWASICAAVVPGTPRIRLPSQLVTTYFVLPLRRDIVNVVNIVNIINIISIANMAIAMRDCSPW